VLTWSCVCVVYASRPCRVVAWGASEEMTQEEFDSLRGVTTKARVDTGLYVSGKGSKAAAAAAAAAATSAADSELLGTQTSMGGASAGAGAGAGASKVPRASADTMFYKITCKVCQCTPVPTRGSTRFSCTLL
jgi:hypothetical protein